MEGEREMEKRPGERARERASGKDPSREWFRLHQEADGLKRAGIELGHSYISQSTVAPFI